MKFKSAVRSVAGWLLLAVCACVAAWALATGWPAQPEVRYAPGDCPLPPVEPVPLQAGEVPVNTAGADTLVLLNGVGPAVAQRIIDEREANGPFYYPEDLVQVSGIGPATLEKIRNMVDMEVDAP